MNTETETERLMISKMTEGGKKKAWKEWMERMERKVIMNKRKKRKK